MPPSLSPAKAGLVQFVRVIPGLTPGATLCRHLRWLVELLLSKPLSLHQLGTVEVLLTFSVRGLNPSTLVG